MGQRWLDGGCMVKPERVELPGVRHREEWGRSDDCQACSLHLHHLGECILLNDQRHAVVVGRHLSFQGIQDTLRTPDMLYNADESSILISHAACV